MATNLGLDDLVNGVSKKYLSGFRGRVERLLEAAIKADRNPFNDAATATAAESASLSPGQVIAYAGLSAPTGYPRVQRGGGLLFAIPGSRQRAGHALRHGGGGEVQASERGRGGDRGRGRDPRGGGRHGGREPLRGEHDQPHDRASSGARARHRHDHGGGPRPRPRRDGLSELRHPGPGQLPRRRVGIGRGRNLRARAVERGAGLRGRRERGTTDRVGLARPRDGFTSIYKRDESGGRRVEHAKRARGDSGGGEACVPDHPVRAAGGDAESCRSNTGP